MMKHAKILSLPHSNKWFLLLFALIFVQVTTCDDVQSPPGTTPTEGLLCISDCAACPVICSPPPCPVNAKSPTSPPSPPSPSMRRQPSPPWRYYSPSQPYVRAPPPSLFPLPLAPEASPPPPPTPPPPAYVSWGNAEPPPPGNVPTVQAPPGMGQRNYSYPYYYYYASKAASSSYFSFQGSSIFVLSLSIHACIVLLFLVST